MSDYKRLTKRETKYLDGEIVCPELVRLQELENKIENGTLIELPCRVGDKLFIIAQFVNSGEWVLSNDYSVGDFIVTDIYLNINREPKFKINSYTIKLSDFGKTVFLTKPEAEAKLEQIRKEAL